MGVVAADGVMQGPPLLGHTLHSIGYLAPYELCVPKGRQAGRGINERRATGRMRRARYLRARVSGKAIVVFEGVERENEAGREHGVRELEWSVVEGKGAKITAGNTDTRLRPRRCGTTWPDNLGTGATLPTLIRVSIPQHLSSRLIIWIRSLGSKLVSFELPAAASGPRART